MLMLLGNKLCEYDSNKRHDSGVARRIEPANCGVVNTGSCWDLSDFHFPECSARQGDLQLAANGDGGVEWSGAREM